MLCKSCHYPLKQLSEPRCPECGRAFDPNDASTYDVASQRQWWSWRRFLVMTFATYVGLVVVFLALLHAILWLRVPGAPVSSPVTVLIAAIWSIMLWPFGLVAVIIGDLVFTYVRRRWPAARIASREQRLPS